MVGLLFITARDADHKKVNRILLHLRSWRNTTSDEVHDNFQIVTTRHAAEAPPRDAPAHPTSAPVPSGLVYDAWSGASYKDVEAYLTEAYPDDISGSNITATVYILVDDQGVQNGTCILGQRLLSEEPDEKGEYYLLNEWYRTRLPQLYANAMWANLHLANMEFYEWADDTAEPDEDGCFPFTMEGTGISEAGRIKLNECIEKYEKEGRL